MDLHQHIEIAPNCCSFDAQSFTPVPAMTVERETVHVKSGNCGDEYAYEPPPTRDRLPTLPEDLTEYAWLHTGPPARLLEEMMMAEDGSDCRDRFTEIAELDPNDVEDVEDDDDDELYFEPTSIDDMTTGLLVDLWHSDVPNIISYVTGPSKKLVDEREARVLSMMDGTATVGTLLESSGLPVADVLDTLCDLCTRGVVILDRSRRVAISASELEGPPSPDFAPEFAPEFAAAAAP